jgi:hypothetical protein
MLTASSQEAKEKQVTLHDDDPDAAEAVIRHLYNYALEFEPSEGKNKVRFYCDFVVASDKYDIPELAMEATLHLKNYLANSKDHEDVVASLKIVVEDFSDYDSLKDCVSWQIKDRIGELASVPGFSVLVASEPQLLKELVADALQFRGLQSVNRYRCHFCSAIILSDSPSRPQCCKNTPGSMSQSYIAKGT